MGSYAADIIGIAFTIFFLEVLNKQLKTLVKRRLWAQCKIHLLPCLLLWSIRIYLNQIMTFKLLCRLVRITEESLRGQMRYFSCKCLKSLLCFLIHTLPLRSKKFKVLSENQCIFWQERKKRGTLFPCQFVLYIGNNHHQGHLLQGKLAFYIKGTDTLYGIGKELNTVWRIIGERENIHNTPTHGKLPWLTHEIYPLELVFKKCFIEHIQRKALTPLKS